MGKGEVCRRRRGVANRRRPEGSAFQPHGSVERSTERAKSVKSLLLFVALISCAVALSRSLVVAGVPPDRQKLMSKAWKGILKDEAELSSCALADGMAVTLMGSCEIAAKATTKAVSRVSVSRAVLEQRGREWVCLTLLAPTPSALAQRRYSSRTCRRAPSSKRATRRPLACATTKTRATQTVSAFPLLMPRISPVFPPLAAFSGAMAAATAPLCPRFVVLFCAPFHSFPSPLRYIFQSRHA